jgi:sugar phosphate isomerase/epimerase
MANKAHEPFTQENPELATFLSKLREYSYTGPLTLELSHKTSTQEILKTKALFEKIAI